MAGTYTIEQLGQKAVWENDANKGDYPAILTGVEGEVLVFHDSSSDYDPPKIGDELFGEVSNDKRGRARFRRGSKGSSPGGHRPRGGSSDPPDRFDRKPEHPRNESRMIHTSALSAAPDYYRLLREETGTDGKPVLPQPKGLDHAKRTLMAIAVWLEETYQGALGGAESPPAPAQEVPVDTAGLDGGDKPSSPDDDIPF